VVALEARLCAFSRYGFLAAFTIDKGALSALWAPPPQTPKRLEMTSGRALARVLGFIVLCLVSAPGAGAPSGNGELNAYVVKAPIAGLPKGPFSQWSEVDKKNAVERVGGFCRYLCVEAYENNAFPNEAAANLARAEVKVCLGACIAAHLPADHPQLATIKEQLRANYEKAKQLGSSTPWPLPGK
jgi:hypothetical protein